MEHWSMVERFQPVSKKGEAADPSAPSCSVISSTPLLQQLQLLHTHCSCSPTSNVTWIQCFSTSTFHCLTHLEKQNTISTLYQAHSQAWLRNGTWTQVRKEQADLKSNVVSKKERVVPNIKIQSLLVIFNITKVLSLTVNLLLLNWWIFQLC